MHVRSPGSVTATDPAEDCTPFAVACHTSPHLRRAHKKVGMPAAHPLKKVSRQKPCFRCLHRSTRRAGGGLVDRRSHARLRGVCTAENGSGGCAFTQCLRHERPRWVVPPRRKGRRQPETSAGRPGVGAPEWGRDGRWFSQRKSRRSWPTRTDSETGCSCCKAGTQSYRFCGPACNGVEMMLLG